MRLEKERIEIVEYGKKLISSGLTKGTSGNISIYNKEEGLMAVSPSGMDYFEVQPDDVVVMNLNGDIVEGIRKPSSEYHLHSLVYQSVKNVSAVVHTHSTNASTMSVLRETLPAVHYMIAITGSFEVPCAEYETFGTEELAQSVVKAMGDGKACFLANHGLLTCGTSLRQALAIAENVEWISELYLKAKVAGKVTVLNDEEMQDVLTQFPSYGQTKKIV